VKKMTGICIIMGSKSDDQIAKKATDILDQMGEEYEVHVASAHRNPEEVDRIMKTSNANVFIGIAGLAAHLPGVMTSNANVFIGIAGLAAHLPGVMASKTDKPVIGVPVSAKLGGLDSLLSIVQMPKGVPVATVGIDRADNAALLAVRILSIGRGG
jgi:5-(carboxyamino)imidazole ribonucleotide mutase